MGGPRWYFLLTHIPGISINFLAFTIWNSIRGYVKGSRLSSPSFIFPGFTLCLGPPSDSHCCYHARSREGELFLPLAPEPNPEHRFFLIPLCIALTTWRFLFCFKYTVCKIEQKRNNCKQLFK